jgi:8-oxo-dGTP pyrophosphatase MutT (NUDIX family)
MTVPGRPPDTIGCMQTSAAQAFFNALNTDQHNRLRAFAADAVQALPSDNLRWYCGEQVLGWLPSARAVWLSEHLPGCSLLSKGLVWQAAQRSPQERSDLLQAALLAARAQGLLRGWRNEPFSFWHADCAEPDPQLPALFQAERSGYRFLGLLSHAVHVNGFTPDGRLWCGQRAASKATDPGLLDNLAAGGLPSGEPLLLCLQRELAEEAGLFCLQGLPLQACGSVRTTRPVAEGWHDEFVHVYNLSLDAAFVPQNQDGEVAGFQCLYAGAVLEQIEAGAFTVDAVQTLIQGLRNCT